MTKNLTKSLKARELVNDGSIRPEQFTSAASAHELHLDEDGTY
jgi:hypothetical protein